jgi:hypothetical protein
MTIKTQGGKVITKDGKVSCECCEEGECCMYPTRALKDGKYVVGDLPDTVVIRRSSQDFVLYKGVWSGNPAIFGELAAAGAFYGREEEEFDEVYIAYSEGYSYEEGWEQGAGIGYIGDPCLFGEPDSTINRDEFEDSYQVSGPISGTVFREKVCLWRGTGIVLKYNGNIEEANSTQFIDTITGTFKFKINGNNKIGFNNTPVGSYAGGYTVS